MTLNIRFMSSIIKTAQETEVALPWTRGARRAAFIVKRNALLNP